MYWLTLPYHLVTRAGRHAIIWKKIQSLTHQKKSFSRQAENGWRNSQSWKGEGYRQKLVVRHREEYKLYNSEDWGLQPFEAFKGTLWCGYRQVFEGGKSRDSGKISWKKRITKLRYKTLNSGLRCKSFFYLNHKMKMQISEEI